MKQINRIVSSQIILIITFHQGTDFAIIHAVLQKFDRIFFDRINEQSRGEVGKNISNAIIEEILKADPDILSEYSKRRISIVTAAASAHTDHMLAEIAQKGFDFDEDKTVFMGGGSILLKEFILKTSKVKKPVFINDIHANAKGYRLIFDMQNSNVGAQAHGA